jgi:hypothetical protein
MPDNRVTLTPLGEIMLSYTPNNREAHKRLLAKLKQLAERLEDDMSHFIPHDVYLRSGSLWRESRTRAAPAASAPIRPPAYST